MHFPRHLLVFVLAVLCLSSEKSNAFGLGDEIINITITVLGSQAFKDRLMKEENFVSDKYNVDLVIRELAADIEKKISDREHAVAKLKDAVKRSFYRKSWGQYEECCNFDEFALNFKYDKHFPGKVEAI